MSLCAAWVREAENTQELVFVTDSTLTGGEKWDHGIKLFEIPHTNCLLSFVGSTTRAYTLVLNLISSITSDNVVDATTSIVDVLDHTTALFTVLVKEIISEISGEDIHELRSDAKFLFGGWDWEKGAFRIWRVYYSRGTEEILYEELKAERERPTFVDYIGDAHHPDIEQKARDDFDALLECEGKIGCTLDMEPAKILRDIVRDPAIREIGGSLQIAKLYRSNKIDFFGIYWPSAEGNPHFQGREYHAINKPNVKYYDPDTFEILEMDVPETIEGIEPTLFGAHYDFVELCYPEGRLKTTLQEKEKMKLKNLFQSIAYQQFLGQCNQTIEIAGDDHE